MATSRTPFATRSPVTTGIARRRDCSRRSAPSSSSTTRLRRCAPGCRGSRPTSSRRRRDWPSGSPGRRDARVAGPREAPHCASPRRPGRRPAIAWAKGWSCSGMRSAALWAVNNRRAIDYAQRALDHLPADRPTERILALMTHGIGHLHHGEPAAAEAAFSDVRTLIDTSGRSWLRPFEMTYSAAVLMQQGRLLEASMLCRQVIRAAGDRAHRRSGRKRHCTSSGASTWSGDCWTTRGGSLNRADEQAEATQTLHVAVPDPGGAGAGRLGAGGARGSLRRDRAGHRLRQPIRHAADRARRQCAASPLLAELEPAGPRRALGRQLRSRSLPAARVRAADRAPDLRAAPAPAGAARPGAGDPAAHRRSSPWRAAGTAIGSRSCS